MSSAMARMQRAGYRVHARLSPIVPVRDWRAELAGHNWGPFTQRAHEEVYRFCIETVRRLSPSTPVSVCHGTTATWRALGEAMRMSPEAYICNCGPQSTPGGIVYDRWHVRT
jgi:hypothetical protein